MNIWTYCLIHLANFFQLLRAYQLSHKSRVPVYNNIQWWKCVVLWQCQCSTVSMMQKCFCGWNHLNLRNKHRDFNDIFILILFLFICFLCVNKFKRFPKVILSCFAETWRVWSNWRLLWNNKNMSTQKMSTVSCKNYVFCFLL